MTKKKVTLSQDVQLVSGDLETKLKSNLVKKKSQADETIGDVQVVIEQPIATPMKMVRILMNCDHKCYVGGEWYYLLKDKQYNVPENVKSVLMKANKLSPL